MLYGFPGTGKSSFAIQIAQALMKDMYGEFNSTDMVTLNETDEYQSEFRTSHKVVLFDDIGASRFGLNDTKNPWRKVIDFVNNIKKTALNPNVEMKGKVYIQPDLVILTSNLDFEQGGDISAYIPAFEAIMRRLSRIVKVIDHINVQPLEPLSGGHSGIRHGSYLTRDILYTLRGGRDKSALISRQTYIQELRDAFKSHILDQQGFINNFNLYFDDYKSGKIISKDVNNFILESQSGIDGPEDLRLYNARVQYYLENVDWQRYYIEGLHNHRRELYLTDNGIVRDIRTKITDMCIVPKPFDRAFYLANPYPDDDIYVKAESMVVPSSISLLSSPTCSKIFKEDDISLDINRFFEASNSWVDLKKLYLKYKPAKSFVKSADKKWTKDNDFNNLTPKVIEKFINVYAHCLHIKYRKPALLIVSSIKQAQGLNTSFKHKGAALSPLFEPISPNLEKLSSDSSTLSEDQHIDELLSFFLCMKPSNIYKNLKFNNLGEVDLILKFEDFIAVFEAKRSNNPTNLSIAKEQAIKYSSVIELLQPKTRVFGFVYTYAGLRVVFDNAIPYESNVFDILFKIIGHTKL